ncbi:MAG TPA: HAMP domain-containing sensor histidine kinase [Flavilitoribacter sp.]|nr:HAMP domain-containing sensor histidine kinase [Flavilitoribacter sp.]HMQ90236.1 HAMP domain-containing sensor histidine kinase [Flavilitoribacter sp.]
MSDYTRKIRWKLYLAIFGALIVVISMVYTNRLAGRLADEERKKVDIWVKAMLEVNDFNEEDEEYEDISLHWEIISSNTTIPVIIADEAGKIIDAVNFGPDLDNNKPYLAKEVAKLQAAGFEPIESYGAFVYYKESRLLTQLRYFPLVQFMLIAAFILFGYLGVNAARRAEQNRVWVGMAKETAHQLGTPISAIIAWLEHLNLAKEGDPEVQEVVMELRNDVNRLELIAERFSKIGSAPVLAQTNIYEELAKCARYMEKRASRKVVFDFPDQHAGKLNVHINAPLFDWVVENLLRNALDAMDGKGCISAEIYEDASSVYIDITDTGKGIPPNKFKTVFQPGFTTKKRGWGLGLSLAKRIIEEYHLGKIFVKRSVPNEGTTFTIRLPKSPASAHQAVTAPVQEKPVNVN